MVSVSHARTAVVAGLGDGRRTLVENAGHAGFPVVQFTVVAGLVFRYVTVDASHVFATVFPQIRVVAVLFSVAEGETRARRSAFVSVEVLAWRTPQLGDGLLVVTEDVTSASVVVGLRVEAVGQAGTLVRRGQTQYQGPGVGRRAVD